MRNLVEELVQTRINGNSIKGNPTYEKMLKRVTVQDIVDYATVYDISPYKMHGPHKIDYIEEVRKAIEKGI